MFIGSRIRYLRQKRKLTQEELGVRVGFPASSASVRIAQYESGDRTPKAEILNRMAEALDVCPCALKVPDLRETDALMHMLFALEDMGVVLVDKYGDQPTKTYNLQSRKERKQ